MAKDEFQANWRGARKYQFDEETRRKQVALDRKYSDLPATDDAKVGPWSRPDKIELPPAPAPTEPPVQPEPKRRRRLLVRLLIATIALVAGYVSPLLFERPQVLSPIETPSTEPQSGAQELPAKVPLPTKRPHK